MDSAERILQQLRQRGERITIQRRMVIEALCEDCDHLTINDIQKQMESRGYELDEATIYRILQWLKAAEVISQTDLGARGIVYELIGTKRHHHLVCLNCHAVIELDDSFADQLREQVRHEHDFEPRVDHLAIFGWCAQCRAAKAATKN
jgi:Fur family ferric uptake transcriptional regulator